jgi:hypothetical protein
MYRCEKGVDFLAMRTIVVTAAAAVLIITSSVYVNDFTAKSSQSAARMGAGKIAQMAMGEYAVGSLDTGAGRDASLTVPGSVRSVTFGAAPGGNTLGNARLSRMYFVEFGDGHNETYVAAAPFAIGNRSSRAVRDSAVTLYPGTYALELKSMTVNGTPMVVIYGDFA